MLFSQGDQKRQHPATLTEKSGKEKRNETLFSQILVNMWYLSINKHNKLTKWWKKKITLAPFFLIKQEHTTKHILNAGFSL